MTAVADSFFVDTNVVLYWVAAKDTRKQPIAREWIDVLWATRLGRLSWQVVFEFYANAERKCGAPPAVARAAVQDLARWEPVTMGHPTIRRAWDWCDAAKINFWDALIVAAAEQAGCRWLLSEDFQEGRSFGSVMVVNPFAQQPAEFGLVK